MPAYELRISDWSSDVCSSDLPDIPVVAEEAMAAGEEPVIEGNRLWLVEPLDGTKEFLNPNGEFTVNIAHIEDGQPAADRKSVVSGKSVAIRADLGGSRIIKKTPNSN